MLKASVVRMSTLALLITVMATFSSCSSPNTTTVSSESVRIVTCPTSTVTFASISNFLFQPNSVSIAVNDIVKWTNNDATSHTVTSGTPGAPDGKFDSGNLAPNATVCMQFMAAGMYQYFCNIHPSMTGSVAVQ
jgi:plastocyanin